MRAADHPNNYDAFKGLPINHNYLKWQFADYPEVLAKIGRMVEVGDFTLGRAVDEFEAKFAGLCNTKYAIGVGNGTDALFLSLKALGIGPGDEVITTPYTFFATVGAIVTAGAKPVFVDIAFDCNINSFKIEAAITPRTKAIIPVHWAGTMCHMVEICEIAHRRGIAIIEDACHAIMAEEDGRRAGSLGEFGCFSMHPLKNLNVWGDGGVITTNRKDLYDEVCLLRNHGLRNRDECVKFAYNSRLDTLQAIVANHVIDNHLENITAKRMANGKFYDIELAKIDGVRVIPSRFGVPLKRVYHLYMMRCDRRDELRAHLVKHGIDVKVHYPIPMHLQPAAKFLGHRIGDFPETEKLCSDVISLPVHEFITEEQRQFVVDRIREFYG